jgi:hypothetical protein
MTLLGAAAYAALLSRERRRDEPEPVAFSRSSDEADRRIATPAICSTSAMGCRNVGRTGE